MGAEEPFTVDRLLLDYRLWVLPLLYVYWYYYPRIYSLHSVM